MGSCISAIYDRYENGYLYLCEKENIPKEEILDVRGNWPDHFEELKEEYGYVYHGVLKRKEGWEKPSLFDRIRKLKKWPPLR